METALTGGRSHFDILLVGPFALYRDGRPIDTRSWQRKVQALFRILATSPGRRRSRDELICILWPEASSEAGGRNLRVVLHMLRRGLGGGEPSPVVSEAGWVALNPAHEWDIDLDRFLDLAARAPDQLAALEEAAGYYRGEPLVDDRYDDWAQSIRGRVQHLWHDLCLRLAQLQREGGVPEAALLWLERALESDPLDEDALRRLVMTLGGLGRRTEAVRRYQQFAQRLKAELDLAPSRETLEAVEALKIENEPDNQSRNQSPAEPITRPWPITPRYPLPVDWRLIGRETELGRILWVLPPLHTVAPRLILVTGEEGIGKTRLLAEVAQRARQAGLLTLAGGCFRFEGRLLYGPLRDALSDYLEEQPEPLLRGQLERLLDDLARIVPELRLRFPDVDDTAPRGEDDGRLRLFLAVTKALERIGNDTPVVLLLDDLQWADEPTLQLLHFLVRRLSHNRILLVGAYRIEEGEDEPPVAALADDMEHSGWATRIHLQPLREADLTSILEEQVRGRLTPELTALLASRSGGNPLSALRLLRLLQQEGRLERDPAGWKLVADGPEIPGGLTA